MSKQFSREIGLADVARSLIINKHIISVQELDNGNYLVEFAGHSSEDMEMEEDAMKEEESEEERGHDEEHDEEKYHDDDDKDASYHDDDSEDEKDKMKDEDEDEEKYMSLDDFLRELRQFNN